MTTYLVCIVGLSSLACSLCLTSCGSSIGLPSVSRHFVPVRVSDRGVGKSPETYADLEFVDAEYGWVAVVGEQVLCTSDGGLSWVPTDGQGEIVEFLDERCGWIVRGDLHSTSVSRTLDGGASYSGSEVPDKNIVVFAAASAQEAWGVSSSHSYHVESSAWQRGAKPTCRQVLLHTTDGGKWWEEVAHPLLGKQGVSVCAASFLDERRGWFVTDKGPHTQGLLVMRTEDGGKTFEVARTPHVKTGSRIPWQVHFHDANVGWAAVGGPSLLRTTDGGKTWHVVTPDLGRRSKEIQLHDCSFPTIDVGWVVGRAAGRAVALRTRDGGRTWERVKTGAERVVNGRLDRVVFVDEDHGWIAGSGGIAPSDFRILPREPRHHQITFILKYVP